MPPLQAIYVVEKVLQESVILAAKYWWIQEGRTTMNQFKVELVSDKDV